MPARGPFAHFTNAELKARADDVVERLPHADTMEREVLLDQIAALRDEMALRRPNDDDDDATGVREPRKPLPGGSAAAAAIDTAD